MLTEDHRYHRLVDSTPILEIMSGMSTPSAREHQLVLEAVGIAPGRSGQITGATIQSAIHWLPEWLLSDPVRFITTDGSRTIACGEPRDLGGECRRC